MTALRTLSFPAPAGLLNMNDRMHWAPKARVVEQWRTRVYWASFEHGWSAIKANELPPCIVDIALPVRTAHKRDPHNYTPTCKAIVDGLVDAGWWPDDNSDWVSVNEPVLVVGGKLVCVTVKARVDSVCEHYHGHDGECDKRP